MKLFANDTPYTRPTLSRKDSSGWQLLSQTLDCFYEDRHQICTEYQTEISNKFDNMKKKEQEKAKEYLKSRYSPKWYEDIEEMFSLDILSML